MVFAYPKLVTPKDFGPIVVFAYPKGYPEGFWPIRLGMASREARLAQKLLAELNLTHVPGLKQKCTELGLVTGISQREDGGLPSRRR